MDAMNVFQGIGVEVALVALRFAIPVLVILGICRINNGACRLLNIPKDESPPATNK